ncbi:DUF2256 domain-containing protein [Rhizobium skierniewicense]|nr:DUF2256 domain-containing protein [Rhizobium skierniewicense]
MPKRREKSDLPTKFCPVCNRPFSWRKKWKKTWDNVKFCSQRCRETKERF